MINLEMPEDVQDHVREYQARVKVERKTANYSQQQAIIAIIREHKLLSEKKKPSDSPEDERKPDV